MVGDQIIIRQNTYTTALQLATVEVFGLDNCLIDESQTGHKCSADGSKGVCAGARTCSRWGWCQGKSGCTPITPPVEIKPYQVVVEHNQKKCVDAEADFAEKETADISLDQCSELAFENGAVLFHHRTAVPTTNTKSACQICMLDSAIETMDLFTVHRITPNFPATLKSWDNSSCQYKCPPHEYMVDSTQTCQERPKCANKAHYREKTMGACISCPAGQEPSADQQSCAQHTPIQLATGK